MSGSIEETNAALVFTKRVGVRGDLYVATIADNLALDGSHGTKIHLTPTSDCDVVMPPRALCMGVTYQITNAATGGYALTIIDDLGATIATIAQGEIGWVHCTGDAWQSLGRADLNTGDASTMGDLVCTAVIALGASDPGVATKALTLALFRADGTTAITTERTVLIRTSLAADVGSPASVPVATVTFSTATVGAILGSGAGWAVVRSSASGAFACTCTDSADETVMFGVGTPTVVDTLARSCLCVPSARVQATWN